MPLIAVELHNTAMEPEESLSPPPDLLVTGHFKARPGYRAYRPRGSPNWYASLTLRGQGVFEQPDFELRTNPGDLVVLRPHAFHDYAVPAGGTWEFVWAHFNPRPDWLSWWQLPELGAGRFVVRLPGREVFERARRAMLRLHADVCAPQGLPRDFIRKAPEPGPYREHLAELDGLQRDLALSGLEEVLLLAVRESKRMGPRILDPRIRQVLDLIASDPSARHDPRDLARSVALSPSRLAHLFKQETGETIGNTLLGQRMSQAARLLEATDLPVGTIAEELGYSSLYHFSRQFHYHFGAGPRAFRGALHRPPPDR
ncbi:MAG TPA: helix-turn-helix domain-containing protein [Chloroflexota bacterium]|nr:helix-turn-helix domain-containing protein [Chloroflexota bacterium]